MKKLFIAIFLMNAVMFAQDFSVSKVSGKAEVLKNDRWIALNVGDTIQTGFRSSLTLEKSGEATVEVGALTRMTVEQLVDGNSRMFIASGGLKSNVEPNKRLGFTVRTPVATASVRGIEFNVENTFGGTDVSTMRGSVAVWNGSNSVSVAPSVESGETDTVDVAYEEAPRGTVIVTQNQTTQMSSAGNVDAPSEVAAARAVDTGSSVTTPAGEGDAEDADERDGSCSSIWDIKRKRKCKFA